VASQKGDQLAYSIPDGYGLGYFIGGRQRFMMMMMISMELRKEPATAADKI